MRRSKLAAVIPASAAEVFALVHDYDRRLEWDTMLRRAELTDGHTAAAKGATSICVGRRRLGGLTFETKYVSFDPPRVAAVELVSAPLLFASWAASIRHGDLGPDKSTLEYTFHFRARPRFLAWLLEPILVRIFRWETRRRLKALARYFAARVPQVPETVRRAS